MVKIIAESEDKLVMESVLPGEVKVITTTLDDGGASSSIGLHVIQKIEVTTEGIMIDKSKSKYMVCMRDACWDGSTLDSLSNDFIISKASDTYYIQLLVVDYYSLV